LIARDLVCKSQSLVGCACMGQQVAATATAHAQALQTAAASADARLKALQEQVTTAEQATVAASTGQAMARAHARDAEAETKAAQARAHEAMETLEVKRKRSYFFRWAEIDRQKAYMYVPRRFCSASLYSTLFVHECAAFFPLLLLPDL